MMRIQVQFFFFYAANNVHVQFSLVTVWNDDTQTKRKTL